MENRTQVLRPLMPAFLSRRACRKLGHYPWSQDANVCTRCGIQLEEGDRIQDGIATPNSRSTKDE